MQLTADDWEELRAINDNVRALGLPTFQHRINWPRLEQMAKAGLIDLGPHPDFNKRDFKAVSLTQAGMFKLRDFQKSESQ